VLGFGAVVEPGGLEALEQVVGAGHVHGEAAADGDVAQGGGQVRLAGAGRYPRFTRVNGSFSQVRSLLRLM
jgi:hypothetical protein